MKKLKLNPEDNTGWTLDLMDVINIRNKTENMEDITTCQVEAVALAMVDLGYVEVEKGDD